MLDVRNLDLHDQRVLIRADLNVPMQDGKITAAQRIVATLPTLDLCLLAGAKVMIMSHVGRPVEGEFDASLSLQPVADYLSRHYQKPVALLKHWLQQPVEPQSGELIVLENCRFNKGEMANDRALGQQLAKLCDIFVMDAFGTAHRAQASTHAVAEFAPIACAGPLLLAELDAINNALKTPKRPVVALVGGSKVSTKLTILEALAKKVDYLIVGGGIANSFLFASGKAIGASLCETNLVTTAQRLMQHMQQRQASIPIATDVVVAKQFSHQSEAIIKSVDDIEADDMILDLGPQSVEQLCQIIAQAATVIWNGPVGVFEFPAFAEGTRRIAEAIAHSDAFSIAGGGDTLAAIEQFAVGNKISYISTGGGAFLELLEGKTLPAVDMLQKRA